MTERMGEALWDSLWLISAFYSRLCRRILFSSSTKLLSDVACPMSLFLFSFCWKLSTFFFFADKDLSCSSSDCTGVSSSGKKRAFPEAGCGASSPLSS
uniref:Uncharacterized protein n=1 Tax=Anguilla anguilla TaxID=7936 RepID=A0A0E9XL82_ANGAN